MRRKEFDINNNGVFTYTLYMQLYFNFQVDMLLMLTSQMSPLMSKRFIEARLS